jgi:hypothetical protein
MGTGMLLTNKKAHIGVDTRRRATAPAFCLFNKKGFFLIWGNKDFIGVAI